MDPIRRPHVAPPGDEIGVGVAAAVDRRRRRAVPNERQGAVPHDVRHVLVSRTARREPAVQRLPGQTMPSRGPLAPP